MLDSWRRALNAFSYPVDLTTYKGRTQFPGFFKITIAGDRQSTMELENHFQKTASENIAPFFEVIYWKLYSRHNICQNRTRERVCYVQRHGITCKQLWEATLEFVEVHNIANLRKIRKLMGFTTAVLATPLTLPAFANPKRIPMIDMHVAQWVNCHIADHNRNRLNKLSRFHLNYSSLRDNDFPNYLDWVAWSQEVAQVLTKLDKNEWRVRDVEMAVFTAQRNRMRLNTLPLVHDDLDASGNPGREADR